MEAELPNPPFGGEELLFVRSGQRTLRGQSRARNLPQMGEVRRRGRVYYLGASTGRQATILGVAVGCEVARTARCGSRLGCSRTKGSRS